MTPCSGSMLRSPTSKTQVYTHTGGPVGIVDQDILPHTSLIRSLFIVPYEIKNECSEENNPTDEKNDR